MKLYAPKYYKKFRCIADKCEHSCCIGWEIDIDGNTIEKYKTLSSGYASAILDSVSMEGTPHFKLCDGDRCPHLDERGLCRIIVNEGEEYLCDICREHPRFYNFSTVAEVGIGMSCIEAARVILSSDDYSISEEIGEIDAEAEYIDFDSRAKRAEIYGILQSDTCDYSTKLMTIAQSYCLKPRDDQCLLKVLDSLEYLDTDHKKLFSLYSSSPRPDGADKYLERFLAYLIYRHCTESADLEDLRVRLDFCLFCEELLASLICENKADSLERIAALASIISEEIEYSEDNTFALMYYRNRF